MEGLSLYIKDKIRRKYKILEVSLLKNINLNKVLKTVKRNRKNLFIKQLNKFFN